MTDETHYAFPHKFQSGPDETTVCFGMTLRDYFAAKAMHHWLSLPIDDHQRQKVAVEAYKVADAMLKARDVE
jgi:hypothetical protein